jgi:hypothetical protein
MNHQLPLPTREMSMPEAIKPRGVGPRHQSRARGAVLLLLGYGLLPPGLLFEFFGFAAMRPGGQKPVLAPLVGGVFALLGCGVLYASRFLVRQGKKHRSRITVLSEVLDGEAYVLYLRTFTDDPRLAAVAPHTVVQGLGSGSEATSMQSFHTEEQQLGAAVAPFGKLVAVGRPGERLPEVGAERLYLPHDDWQDAVQRLMAGARMVVLVLGLGPSLRWEIGQVVQRVPPERLVLLVPMTAETYELVRQETGPLFPRSLPGYPVARRLKKYQATIRGAIHFEADWTPRFVRFDTPQSPGNFQRVIESRFVYGLRPVYDRLGARWPGMTLRLPTHARLTRRQVPLFCVFLAVPMVVIGLLVLQITGG